MSQQGAALQGYNNELIKCLEDLCSKRDELHKQICQEEEEKQKIQSDLRILTERLSQINESLARKIATRNDFDKTIAETESAYKKILESSQTLLHVLKREANQLQDRPKPNETTRTFQNGKTRSSEEDIPSLVTAKILKLGSQRIKILHENNR